jgi:hypothetical protein
MLRFTRIVLTFCCAVSFCVTGWAQSQTTTSIIGTVTDADGAVVPGVQITVRNDNTGAVRETETNSVGSYAVQALRPGTYSITATLEGFKTAIVEGREVQVSIPAAVNLVLEIGDFTTEITVSAVGAELINTTTGALATTISENLVDNLPNQTRNYFDLLALAPNTSPQYIGSGHLSFGSHSMRRVNAAQSFESSGVFAAGSTDSATNVTVDGANVQMAIYNMPVTIQSASTIQELRLETASANAEFGFGSNGITVITKSGSNDFHGEAFLQHRNDNLDANGFFTNLAGRGVPEYKRNKFGATLGGPIIRNKLHFFGNFEGSRLRQASQGNRRVPTAAVRSGDISSYRPLLAGQVLGETPIIYNPFEFDATTGLRQAFPNNRIPATMLDPGMQELLTHTALPNTVIDGVPQFSGLSNTQIDEEQYGIRVDWEQSDTTSIFGRFTWSERNALRGGLISELRGEGTPSSTHSTVMHWNKLLSPTLINDFSANYAQLKWGIGRPKDVPDVARAMGLKNTSNLTGSPGISVPDLSVGQSGLFVWSPTQHTFALKDDLAWNVNNHTIKVGFNISERRMYFINQSVDKGRMVFDNIFTRACPLGNTACESGTGLPSGGLGFADFLLGTPRATDLQIRGVTWNGHQRYYGLYVQDTWQLHPKLSLDFGLRYERWNPWLLPRTNTVRYNFEGEGGIEYALQNPLDVFDPALDFGRSAPRNPNMGRSGYTNDSLNFAPRLGLAFLIRPETVFRAAGGIFYANNINTNQFSDTMTGGAPFTVTATQQIAGSEQLPPILARNLFPAPSATGIPGPNETPRASTRALGERNYDTPTVYQWSASVQHRLTPYWSLNADYLGSHTIHNQQFVDLNAPAVPQGPLASLSNDDRRRFPAWGPWLTWVNWGYQNYESVTFSVISREWRGLTMRSSFMWSKNLGTSLSPIANDRNNFDFRNWDQWRGKSALTPDSRYVTAYSYRLPFGRGTNYFTSGAANAVLGGWMVSGIVEFSDGPPGTIGDRDNSGTGLGNQHANRIAGCDDKSATRDRFQWFNTGCFVEPAFGTWGNAGQGIINNPGMNNWNTSIAKTFELGEPHSLEVRVETYNTFNHTQWGNAQFRRSSASFGRISSTRPARQILFSMFYRF